jgi:hypothetical protein
MKKLIIIIAVLLAADLVWGADSEYLIAGGTPWNYEYIVWDDTPGSMEYALVSGTEGTLTLYGGKSFIIKMLIQLGD